MKLIGSGYKKELTRRGVPDSLSAHFDCNIDYFSYLLNKDFKNKSILLTVSDKEKIKEAYSKAHHIREYEINLFWSRLNYLWVINAILFSAWGILVYAMLNAKEIPTLQYVSLFFLSLFGSAFTFLASSIAKAGKYWQEVWEYHVRMLEPFISGRLYIMPFTQNPLKPSISKSVMVFFAFSLIIWVLSAVFAVVIPNINSKFVVIFEGIAVFVLVLLLYVIDKSVRKPSINKVKLDISTID